MTDITCLCSFFFLPINLFLSLPSGCCLPPTVDLHLNGFLLYMPLCVCVDPCPNRALINESILGKVRIKKDDQRSPLKPPHLWAAWHDFHILLHPCTSYEVTAKLIARNSVLCFNTIILQPSTVYLQPLVVIYKSFYI